MAQGSKGNAWRMVYKDGTNKEHGYSVHTCQRNRQVIDSQYTDNKDIPEQQKKKGKKKREVGKRKTKMEMRDQNVDK